MPVSSEVHNNNNTLLSVFNNGFIGDTPYGPTGNGFQYNGINGLFSGTLIIAYNSEQVAGRLYNYEFGTLGPVQPITGSLAGFGQAYESRFNDERMANSIGVEIVQRTHSKSAASDTTAISVRLDEFSVVWISLAENWNGTGQIFLSATLNDSTHTDTVLLTVTPVNDLPSPFELISPVDGWSGGVTTLTFSWSASVDPDTGEIPVYDFALSTDSSFAIVDTFINVGSDTTLTFDSLALGKYYWKVSAFSGLDTVWGSESDQRPWSFTIMPVALETNTRIITDYRLYNNYPNPFNPMTTIRYELPRQSCVILSIYDINGRAVANLVNATQPAGLYSVTWDAGDFGSGVYFYRIQTESPGEKTAGGFRQVRKMILIK